MTSTRQLIQSHAGAKGTAIDAEDQRFREHFQSQREKASAERHEKYRREEARAELANWMGCWQRDIMARRQLMQAHAKYASIAGLICGLAMVAFVLRSVWPG